MNLYEKQISDILHSDVIKTKIRKILSNFNTAQPTNKKHLFVCGDNGTGKTSLVNNVLKEMNYDVIMYDSCDIRNKASIENISNDNMSNRNIMSMFHKQTKQIAIIMDEIDGMNSGDKNGINSLIKILRPKKTKKQKMEDSTSIPIICIGNTCMDKKIKELTNICNIIEIPTPSHSQINQIIQLLMPLLSDDEKDKMTIYCNKDLQKLNILVDIYNIDPKIVVKNLHTHILPKYSNNDTKIITKNIINDFHLSNDFISNDTDRTVIGLLFHENIIDTISKIPKEKSIPFYISVLSNICFGDIIDRITFQKQIWQFNEMSSLIKVFKNTLIYKQFKSENPDLHFDDIKEIRFTKALTKYSTEYNNYVFIKDLCQTMSLDKKDLLSLFIALKANFTDEKIKDMLTHYDISQLYINRIFRYIDKILNGTPMEEEKIDETFVIQDFDEI